MLHSIIAPLRRTTQSLVASDSPAQFEASLTLGMIIGLMPKSNLIALSLCVFLFSMRCNKSIGFAAAVSFSFVATLTDPFAHKLGLYVLGAPSLQASYASVFSMPLGPWMGFHNTVVCGSLLIALYAAYPVYWVTKTCHAAVQRRTAS